MNNKKEIMKLAWHIYAQGTYTFPGALKTAWGCYKTNDKIDRGYHYGKNQIAKNANSFK